jgi:trimethylamine:corrinoid methyltransferase-like protein
MPANTDDRNEVFRRFPLSETDLDNIHAQAMRILENIGTEVDSDVMLRMLGEAGQRVDGTRVRWDAGFVMDQLAKAPGQFTLQGRDPRHPNRRGAVRRRRRSWSTRRRHRCPHRAREDGPRFQPLADPAERHD